MEEAMLTIIGIVMFYSWIHFVFIQHTKVHAKRSQYEKIVTWFAITTFVLYLLGTL
jgi:cytochrome c biogenesis factor